jgi:hypothetical protein
VLVGVVREMLEKAPAPRNVFVRFRLGEVFGEPEHVVQQRAILAAALEALVTVRVPGAIVDLPYRWKRSEYRDPLAPSGDPA